MYFSGDHRWILKTAWQIVFRTCGKKELGGDGGLSFCDGVMGMGVLKGVWELCGCLFWQQWRWIYGSKQEIIRRFVKPKQVHCSAGYTICAICLRITPSECLLIHRHQKSSETALCLRDRLVRKFNDELERG